MKKKENNEEISGIPEFWLQVLKCSPQIIDFINEKDTNALKYLIDIRSIHENDNNYVLEFVFAENPFFEDKVLKRSFKFIEDAYLEKTLEESQGSKIKWKSNQGPKEPKGKTNDEEDHTEEEEDWRFFQFFPKDYSKSKIEKEKKEKEEEDLEFEQLNEFEIYLTALANGPLPLQIQNPVPWFKKPPPTDESEDDDLPEDEEENGGEEEENDVEEEENNDQLD